jgi:hypothetical protein
MPSGWRARICCCDWTYLLLCVCGGSWRYRGQSRPDLPKGCPENLDRETLTFLIWIWQNRNNSRQKIADTVDLHEGIAEIQHLLQSTGGTRLSECVFGALAVLW